MITNGKPGPTDNSSGQGRGALYIMGTHIKVVRHYLEGMGGPGVVGSKVLNYWCTRFYVEL